jgi:hypothetical protein
MKLYRVERGSLFRLVDDTRGPPDIGTYAGGQVLRLGNIDGMYSYCTDQSGQVHHPIAWAEVEVISEENN